MVVGFAKDNMHLTESDLAKLAIDIREGDISVVLKEYEKEIKVKRNMNKSFYY
jgi:nuclear-control-of-ATPase protein 2